MDIAKQINLRSMKTTKIKICAQKDIQQNKKVTLDMFKFTQIERLNINRKGKMLKQRKT